MQFHARFWGGLSAASIALVCCAPLGYAGWSAEPVTVTSTSLSIPIVEGCPDGAGGAFVAWHEKTSVWGGVLRAQHLLRGGDLDPSWPASGAIGCDVVAERAELAVLPDRAGGVYLVWKEPDSLFATRIDSRGVVAAGWPPRGMSLDDVDDFYMGLRPSVIEDGADGFFVAWQTSYRAAVTHLGPASTGTFGWPDEIRYYSAYGPQLALAPDGGVFLIVRQGGSWRLRRLQADGFTSSGWPADGFGWIGTSESSVALSPDGRGGVFLLVGSPAETRLYRRQGDGSTAADWPDSGIRVPFAPGPYFGFSDLAYQLIPDGRDGVLLGMGELGVDNSDRLILVRCTSDATCRFAGDLLPPFGAEIVATGEGRFFSAAFHGNGARSPWDWDAFIQVRQCCNLGAPDFMEEHPEPGISWFGDIGLAATEDGGAVFLWSQVNRRLGLFARRFGPYGEVTWARPRAQRGFGIKSLRFVRGEGVFAAVAVASRARFELFDLGGRRIASQAVGTGARELTVAGTSALPAGLYFGRLVAGERAAAAKLVVTR